MQEYFDNLEHKLYLHSIIIAKVQFDQEVEKGNTQTTSQFEEMYSRFILGDEFDESKAPLDYLTILGRLK